MTTTHLLGFHRKNKEIVPVYGPKDTHYDDVLKYDFKACIVPVELFENENPWVLTEDIDHLSDELSTLIHEKTLFVTNPDAESEYAVFTYAPVHMPEMMRSGVLLKKVDGEFKPLISTIDGEEFLFEIKGCGSPEGGFPGVHYRSQAGAITGTHLRVTGGLAIDGAKAEFKHAELVRKSKQSCKEPIHLRVLGYVPFSIEKKDMVHDFGQIVRLTPSTLRLSFQNNDTMTDIIQSSEEAHFKSLGRELVFFSFAETPLVHRNVNKNNMILLQNGEGVLTDFEEADPAYTYHCNLESSFSVVPLHYFTVDESIQTVFINSFLSVQHPKSFKSRSFKSLEDLNAAMVQHIALSVIRYRSQTTLKQEALIDNYQHARQFMPVSYFKGVSKKWFREIAIPFLEIKREMNLFNYSIYKEHSFEVLSNLWRRKSEDKALVEYFEKGITAIEPTVRKLLGYSVKFQEESIGQYISFEKFIVMFLDPAPEEDNFLKQYKLAIDMPKIAKEMLDSNSFEIGKLGEKVSAEQSRYEWFGTVSNIMYPYMHFLYIYLDNEFDLLNAALKDSDISESEITLVEASIQKVKDLDHLCHHSSEEMDISFKEGMSAFIKKVKLPYMNLEDLT